ncbi:hypothetical protein [Lysinibacillus xylanilyticus]|uniref:hypothetical protein n=1 Tax=Lysinibacillus xylanilyticus TaxID=582475 RepID=UPI003CFCC30A
MSIKMSGNMVFKPYADECTTFENVRVLKFEKESVEVEVKISKDEQKVFINTKHFYIYFNTNTFKILNTLEEVKLISEKNRLKCRLGELIDRSNIEALLKERIALVERV